MLLSVDRAIGSANQANIDMSVIEKWVVPIPPLAEQKRIVTRVEELMGICDQLREQLQQSQ